MKIDRAISLVFLGVAVINAVPTAQRLWKDWQDRPKARPLAVVHDPPGFREAWREVADDLR